MTTKMTTESLLKSKEVSKILKVSPALVYKMADRGQLQAVIWECPSENGGRPKRMIRFEMEEVRRFIENHRNTQ